MTRILAHKIIYRDKVYTMSIATIDSEGQVSIEPFDRETEATAFISGTIKIIDRQDGAVDIKKM